MSDNNKPNQQYGVIREIGDYSAFQKLNEEQNDQYQKQLLQEQEQKRQQRQGE